MNRYTDKEALLFDAWFVNRGDEIHMFHLRNGFFTDPGNPSGWAIGHAVSRDCLHWESLPAVLPPLFDEQNPLDFHSKFTGCAVEKDGDCYLFYTMREKEKTNQSIGVAVSHDWIHFSRYEGNPVLTPSPMPLEDGTRLIGFENLSAYDWNIVDCRDIVIIPCGDEYMGYFAAAADVGVRNPIAVIVSAHSKDLFHWGAQKVVYRLDHSGFTEVPDVYRLGDRWILSCLSGQNYGGRAITGDPYSQNATIYATASSPEGPFNESDDNILLAGPQRSGFTCRSVQVGDTRALMYIDRQGNGKNALSLPKVLHLDADGHLRAGLWDLPKTQIPLKEPTAERNSFAWRTFGGDTQILSDGYLLTAEPKCYHPISFAVGADAIQFDATLCVSGVAGGFFFRTDNSWTPYALLIEPKEKRIALYRMYDFDMLGARSCDFREGTNYSLSCLLFDHTLEVYLDNNLLFQCGIECSTIQDVGFITDRGTLTVQSPRLFSINL